MLHRTSGIAALADTVRIHTFEVGGEQLQALVRNGEPMMLRDLAREA